MKLRQKRPGVCRVFATKEEQADDKEGNGCLLGKEGSRGKNISHIRVFCRARLYKETGNEIVISSAQCSTICREHLLGRMPVVQTGQQYSNKRKSWGCA